MALLFGTTLRVLDAYMLERIQSTFPAVCNHHFSKLPYYTSAEALHSLKLHTLRDRRRRLDALFLLIFPLVLYVMVFIVIKLVDLGLQVRASSYFQLNQPTRCRKFPKFITYLLTYSMEQSPS